MWGKKAYMTHLWQCSGLEQHTYGQWLSLKAFCLVRIPTCVKSLGTNEILVLSIIVTIILKIFPEPYSAMPCCWGTCLCGAMHTQQTAGRVKEVNCRGRKAKKKEKWPKKRGMGLCSKGPTCASVSSLPQLCHIQGNFPSSSGIHQLQERPTHPARRYVKLTGGSVLWCIQLPQILGPVK